MTFESHYRSIMRSSDPVNRFMSTPALTVGPDEHVSCAFRTFAEHAIHHLPVVVGHRIVGIVSSADVTQLACFSPPPDASDAQRDWTITAIMQHPVTTVPEHESIQRAADLMQSKGVHSLPVVNSRDELVGIVTTTDIIRASFASHLGGDSPPRANQPTARVQSVHETLHGLREVKRVARRFLAAGQDERLREALLRAIVRSDESDSEAQHGEVLGLIAE
jgi:CBS domain-containing protein